MATEIKIPTLGESISEGVVSAWLKADGEWVERDEPVLELETDKITMEVPAPAAGVLARAAGEGDTVSVGDTVGAIDESAKKPAGGAPPAKKAKAEQGASGKQSAGATATQEAPKAPPARDSAPPSPGETPSAQPDTDIAATPLARKLAEEHAVSLAAISGTGAGGRVREQDVLAYIQAHRNGQGAAPAPAEAARKPVAGGRAVRIERMSPLRQRVAARLVEAQRTAAMLTTFNECDMSAVMDLRSRHKDAFEKKHGVKLGFMSFFVKAAASALQTFPRVNAFIVDDGAGPAIERHDYCDIAIAVGTKKGLVVPVLRNCESRSFAEVEAGIGELAEKARDGKLSLEDMQGGTFTISNGGVYGSMLSTPILNPPQSGILGMHNIIRRPVERPDKPGSGEVAVRPMMYLALSYDHRMVDGAEAVGFLKHIKESIEAPDRLLLDL